MKLSTSPNSDAWILIIMDRGYLNMTGTLPFGHLGGFVLCEMGFGSDEGARYRGRVIVVSTRRD